MLQNVQFIGRFKDVSTQTLLPYFFAHPVRVWCGCVVFFNLTLLTAFALQR